MADQVDVSGGAPGPASRTAGGAGGSQFGLTAAMALIVGSIIGVGIFNLPTSLAFYGPITLISMALTTVGALALALLFAALSRRLPADGGPYAYARAAFGGVPAFGIVASTVLASIAMIINYLGSNGPTVFTTLVLMTGITAAIPYAFSALAQIKWRLADHREMQTPRFARDMIVAVLSVVFSVLFIWYSRNTGHSFWVYWAPFFLAAGALLLGIPVYLGQRRHMSQPAPVPPYR